MLSGIWNIVFTFYIRYVIMKVLFFVIFKFSLSIFWMNQAFLPKKNDFTKNKYPSVCRPSHNFGNHLEVFPFNPETTPFQLSNILVEEEPGESSKFYIGMQTAIKKIYLIFMIILRIMKSK
jgi:hypothetical protein